MNFPFGKQENVIAGEYKGCRTLPNLVSPKTFSLKSIITGFIPFSKFTLICLDSILSV